MDPPHGVPVRFWLYPLPGSEVIYRELSDNVARRLLKTLEEFEVLARRLQMLRERKATLALSTMTSAVKRLQASFTEFLRTFKSEIKSLRSEVKGKEKGEEALIDVLERLQQLPIAPGKIQKWIESREREADAIELVSKHSKPGQQSKTKSDAQCRVTLVADMYCSRIDDYLQAIDSTVKKYIHGTREGEKLVPNTPEIESETFECMFNDDFKTMAAEFNNCCLEHQNNSNIYFELADNGKDELRRGQMYFEVHDKASQIAQFAEDSLLPDGVSSLTVRQDIKSLMDTRKQYCITSFFF